MAIEGLGAAETGCLAATDPPSDGVRYRVTHRTAYRYGTSMSRGQSLLHLVPRATVAQTVGSSVIATDPAPGEISSWIDAFGNIVTYLGVHRPHDGLEVTATSDVVVRPLAAPAEAGPPWEVVDEVVKTETSADGLLARVCRLPSPSVVATAEVWRFASASFLPGLPLVDALRDLTARIFREFTFDSSFSDISTPLSEVLAHRRGVCQDFAHLAIGCLRSMGVPARYVSGYLETDPPPGQPKMVGADASHAWCAAYVPGWGWLDLDPTNDLVAPQRHITVAWGRDYRDVTPVRGLIVGPAAPQELSVGVDVVRLPA